MIVFQKPQRDPSILSTTSNLSEWNTDFEDDSDTYYNSELSGGNTPTRPELDRIESLETSNYQNDPQPTNDNNNENTTNNGRSSFNNRGGYQTLKSIKRHTQERGIYSTLEQTF